MIDDALKMSRFSLAQNQESKSKNQFFTSPPLASNKNKNETRGRHASSWEKLQGRVLQDQNGKTGVSQRGLGADSTMSGMCMRRGDCSSRHASVRTHRSHMCPHSTLMNLRRCLSWWRVISCPSSWTREIDLERFDGLGLFLSRRGHVRFRRKSARRGHEIRKTVTILYFYMLSLTFKNNTIRPISLYVSNGFTFSCRGWSMISHELRFSSLLILSIESCVGADVPV